MKITKECMTFELLKNNSTPAVRFGILAQARKMLACGIRPDVVAEQLNVTEELFVANGLLDEASATSEPKTYLIPFTTAVKGYIGVTTDSLRDLNEINTFVRENPEIGKAISKKVASLANSVGLQVIPGTPTKFNCVDHTAFLISDFYNQGSTNISPVIEISKYGPTCVHPDDDCKDEVVTSPEETAEYNAKKDQLYSNIMDKIRPSRKAENNHDCEHCCDGPFCAGCGEPYPENMSDQSDIAEDDVNDDVTNEMNQSDIAEDDVNDDVTNEMNQSDIAEDEDELDSDEYADLFCD